MASITASLAREVANVASRAVWVHVNPRPWGLSDSRAVLQVLQRYGEVVSFRNLAFQASRPAANQMIVIFRKEEAAQSAMAAAPIVYTLDPHSESTAVEDLTDAMERSEPWDALSGLGEATSPEEFPSPGSARLPDDPEPFPFANNRVPRRADSKRREFRLSVAPSKMNHQDFVEHQPYWTSFNIQKSMIQQDLAKRVPFVAMSEFNLHGHRPLEDRKEETRLTGRRRTLRQVYELGLAQKAERDIQPSQNAPDDALEGQSQKELPTPETYAKTGPSLEPLLRMDRSWQKPIGRQLRSPRNR